MDKLKLAYCAGVIDSDGTIGVRRSTYAMRVRGDASVPIYSERVHVRQVSSEAIEVLAECFGGNIAKEDPSAKRGKPLYRWGLTDKKAHAMLVAIRPYLRIKRAQADNCIALRQAKEKSKVLRVAKGRGHAGGAPRSPEMSVRMESLYLRAKSLNTVGV